MTIARRITTMLLLALLGAASPGLAAAQGSPGDTAALPHVEVIGLVGEPRVAGEAGEKKLLAVGDEVPVGGRLLMDETSRVAVSITPDGAADNAAHDVILFGSNTAVTLRETEASEQEEGDDWSPPLTFALEQGAFQSVIRTNPRIAQFTIVAGSYPITLNRSVLVGTHNPIEDVSTFLVFADSVRIHVGSRHIRVPAGKWRLVEQGGIKAARPIKTEMLEAAVASTRIPGVNVTQPTIDEEHAEAGGQPEITDPEPWQYDPETDKHFDPSHGHWHAGRPPADKVPPDQQTQKRTRPGPVGGFGSSPDKVDPAQVADQAPAQEAKHLSDDEGVWVRMQTTMGTIILELDRARAPRTVANFASYTTKGLYDGTIFHRVMKDFMIQGGGFDKDLAKKPTDPAIPNEWKNGLKNDRGTIAMARIGGNPDSATNQFFINHRGNPRLSQAQSDGAGYAVFGRVIKGMDVVDAIASVPTARRGSHGNVPVQPVTIEKVTILPRAEALAEAQRK